MRKDAMYAEVKSIWQVIVTDQRRMTHHQKVHQKATKVTKVEKENPQKVKMQTVEKENHRSTKLKQKLQAKRKDNFKSRTQMQQNQKMSLESSWKNSKRQW